MRQNRWGFLGVMVAVAAAGCAGGSRSEAGSSNGTVKSKPGKTTSVQRTIQEADIIQLDAGRLYALSRSGTASIIDVSMPGHLELLGQTTLSGEPFEMYRRGDFLITMSNGAVDPYGRVTTTYAGVDAGGGALVSVLDAHDPGQLAEVATLKVPGEIADSRVVGNVLYLATYENTLCYGCGNAARTMVSTFNIADPSAITLVEQVSFDSNAPTSGDTVWGSNWKRSIFVTEQRLYIGGHAEADTSSDQGIIDVLDITDPGGRLKIGARLTVGGPILSRWQLDEWQGVLRVVSQRGVGQAVNGFGPPEVDTFRVLSAQTVSPLGHLTMNLGRPEGLRAVRFDGAKAYAITYATPQRTDPLFVIDLEDPASPRQRGELTIPGFMYHLEPRGDKILALGVDGTDPNGSLNVSLFDVADPDRPKQLSRVAFAPPYLSEQYAVMNEVAEDQDRIQKAFHVFDGIVMVPFSAPRTYSEAGTACDNAGGGVQLMEWLGDTLTKRALLPLPGNPRRAFEHGQQEMLAVSDSNVRAFSLEDLRVAHQTADVTIGTCVPYANTFPGASGVGSGGGFNDGEPRPPLACSAAGGSFRWSGLALALAALAVARRRPRRANMPQAWGPRPRA
jgi:hypothetical protein